MKSRNLLWVTLGTFALAFGVLVGGFVRTGRAQSSQETVTCRADFPMIALGSQDGARVQATWVDGVGDPINLRIEFLDQAGQVLDEKTLTLAPKETVFASFGGVGDLEAQGVKGTRQSTTDSQLAAFRTAVFVQPASGESGFPAETGCPQVVSSLERFSQTGASSLFVSPSLPIGVFQNLVHALPSPTPPPTVDSGYVPQPDTGYVPQPDSGYYTVDNRPADTYYSVDNRPADAYYSVDNSFVGASRVSPSTRDDRSSRAR